MALCHEAVEGKPETAAFGEEGELCGQTAHLDHERFWTSLGVSSPLCICSCSSPRRKTCGSHKDRVAFLLTLPLALSLWKKGLPASFHWTRRTVQKVGDTKRAEASGTGPWTPLTQTELVRLWSQVSTPEIFLLPGCRRGLTSHKTDYNRHLFINYCHPTHARQ